MCQYALNGVMNIVLTFTFPLDFNTVCGVLCSRAGSAVNSGTVGLVLTLITVETTSNLSQHF